VLFADLSGFTTIPSGRPGGRARRLQTDLFGALRGVIDRFDAYPEKFIGDAVVVVFGAPVAHEDDLQRALGAAEMHACAAELSERWRTSSALRPRCTSAPTRRVVAGRLGTAADAAYAVTGDAVNMAARLQSRRRGQTPRAPLPTSRLSTSSRSRPPVCWR
jgi:adenylate cyclase